MKLSNRWAVVVVLWSALSPTAPKIRVRILLTTKFFSLLYEKMKINEKEAGVGPFLKELLNRKSAVND